MSFVRVLDVEELPPGVGKAVLINGQERALFNVEGVLYCIDNLCPHRDAPLSEGWLEADIVTCPWHAWQINVRTGDVLYTPGMCVATYTVKVEDGGIWVEA